MNGRSPLLEALVYQVAAGVTVPVAKRLGLGAVLGYLIAGALLGPAALGLVGGAGGEDVLHFAEFGVVMMLFVVGLELEPALLWRLRAPILGLGGLQVVGTTAAVGGIALALGLRWQAALAVGMTLALSSTAIVLQTLAEKGLLKSAGGQSTFAVLLFQDIAVIPMLAVFPLLGAAGAGGDGAAHGATTWAGGLPGWAQTLAVLGAVGAVVLAGRFVVRPLFRAVARTGLREIFTAAALALVVGTALLMTQVGLSPALGTFLAGVVLATSEYRHELEGDIEPFKGLLLGLFFISVGATVDFGLVAARPLLVAGLVLGVVAVKLLTVAGLLAAAGRFFGLSLDQRLLVAFALAQVGEFAFVLLSFAERERVLTGGQTAPLVAAVALSMALTPLVLLAYERGVRPRLAARGAAGAPRPDDAVEEGGEVIVVGFGEFGATVGRLLRANGVPTTVLDVDSDRVDLLRAMGVPVYYGDATRLELLEAAGARRARLLVVALGSPEATLRVAREARREFPELVVLARAFGWDDAHDLLAAGVPHVYRESLDTALRLGADALHVLGVRAHAARRATQRFLRHDEESLRQLTAERADRGRYVSAARRRIEELERLLLADRARRDDDGRDSGWDAESLREEVRRGAPRAPVPAPPPPAG
jgi:CPA2 family monovalent cation:H+ antiporter-2/glutathione-regulated potassium-efflux system protein KefB